MLNRTVREAAKARGMPEPPVIILETTRPSLRAFWKGYARGMWAGADARIMYEAEGVIERKSMIVP